jgi:hypothetical protein
LAKWRGYSIEFVQWLHAQSIVGNFDGATVFANHGDDGRVVSCHVRLGDGSWKFEPTGQRTAPLVFGYVKAATCILAFESQWDAFAVMDRYDWHTYGGLQDTAVFITRGANNGKLIRGHVNSGAQVLAFTQNDQAAKKWLADVASFAGCQVYNVATPAPHKDANDWTHAGTTKAEIEAAITAATLIQPRPEPNSNRAGIAAEYLGAESTPKQTELPDLIDATDFLAMEIDPPAELVGGIIHRGSKLALGGSSKSFKTWALLDLGISVATGADWLGFPTAQGRVLFLNFEIQPYPWQQRIIAVELAKNVVLQSGQIILLNLRGHAAGFRVLIPRIIERVRRENFALIILDPIYKLYGGTDENAAGDVAALLNALEHLAVETGAAIAYGCHFAKGNASAKEAIDRISGSGVFARDPDSLLIFTKHEEADSFTVEPILRNFKPVAPFAVRWQFPLMHHADDLDPSKLKQAGGRKPEHAPDDLLALLPAAGLTTAGWQDQAESQGISRRSYFRLRKKLQDTGKVRENITAGTWMPNLPKTTS